MTHHRNIISAVFENRADAERAVDWLRENGVSNDAISVVARQEDDSHATGDAAYAADRAADTGNEALKGAGVGAGVGLIFGLAAAAIPGVGPFITAGALASALGATGGGAAAGAIVGATTGGIAAALSNLGHSDDEAGYYAREIEGGGTFVSVDLDHSSMGIDRVRQAFHRFNGRFADHGRMAA